MALSAFYHDGKRFDRRQVHVELGADGLRFVDETGVLLAFWPYEGLDLAGSASRSEPYQLVHTLHGQASLTSEDRSLLKTLSKICPRIEERTASPVKGLIFKLSVLALTAACAWWFLSLAVAFLAAPLADVVPVTWERQLGSQIAKRLTEQTGVCSHTPGVKALDHLLTRIATVVSIPFPLKVQVTDDPRVNSFAVSGGTIVIFRGMIDEARSSDELAGLLAHEVSHTGLRHPVEGMIRSLGIPFVLSAYLENLSELAFSSAAFKEKLITIVYSPENEAAADSLSSEILTAAKISTVGLVDLFARLRANGASPGSFIARHPQAGVTVRKQTPQAASGAALSKTEWEALKNICSEKITVR